MPSCARQGRADDARELLQRAGPAGLVGLADLALGNGDARGAANAAVRVLRRVPETALLDRLPALEVLARAQVRLGQPAAAERHAAEVERASDAFGTPYVRGRAKLLRAELAAVGREHEEARRASEDAIDCLEEASAPYDVARARLELARALLALGRSERGRDEALAARAVFATLGAGRDLAVVDELLSAEHAGGPALSELTPREVEILRLVARGLSDAEIAERLVVSPHTVHRHVANIRTKLRLPSRSAAVAYAAREGLL